MIRRITANISCDLAALISFIPMVVSGLILYLYWPTGSRGFTGGRNPFFVSEIFGLSHENWVLIHDWSSLFFVIFVVIHLILHYRFFRFMKKHILSTHAEKK
ncbi:MAG: DUF4405 domain-containing protein [Methanospirillaceae archaeon]|nr:DUF4405 domain-containing protein [Methanospirillaceae archaeon]